jgi:hypothetical protein
MSDIERIRALLRERQENEAERGTAYAEVTLRLTLVEELAQLYAERADLLRPYERAQKNAEADPRLATMPRPDTADLDAKIDAKKAEVKAATVRFDFRVLPSADYTRILAAHPNTEDDLADRKAFFDDLARAGLIKVTLGDGEPIIDEDERLEVFDAVKADVPFGEWEPVRDTVFDLNRRKISIPF